MPATDHLRRFRLAASAGELRAARADVHLWLAPLDVEDDLARRLGGLLSAEEAERAARYRRPRDQARFSSAHGWLRAILAAHLDCRPSDLDFERGAGDKPYLKGRRGQFNLSHSGGRVLIGFSEQIEIGVDIERIRPMKDASELARRFFSVGEQQDLDRTPQRERERCFFDCWTRKEAYVKALGDGLSHGLDRFRVSCAPGSAPEMLEIEGSREKASGWSLVDLKPNDDWAAAMAAPRREITVAMWSAEDPSALAG